MHRIIGNQRMRAAEWANMRFGTGLGEDDKFTALILEKDLEIQAVVYYTDWAPGNSIDVHLAAIPGRRWLTRPFLSAAFRYPFLELGVRRMGATIAANNADSLRWTKHCGFIQEGVKRKAGQNGIDLIIFGLLREECRFLDGPPPEIWSITDIRVPIHAPGSHTGKIPLLN